MERRSGSLVSFFAVAIALVGVACEGEPGARDRDRAVARVVEEVLAPAGIGAEQVIMYGAAERLEAGTTIAPVMMDDGSDPIVTTLEQPAWFFWVDLVPYARFSHPTQFIRVDADGQIQVEEHSWYPLVDGVEFLPVEDAADPRRVFGDPEYPVPDQLPPEARIGPSTVPPPVPTLGTAGLKDVAVVVNAWPGSTNTQVDYENMSKMFGDRGYEVIGVPPSAHGASQTRADILSALRSVASRAEPMQQFVFYYTGHASPDLLAMGAEMNSPSTIHITELLPELVEIDAVEIVLILDACNTGSFVEGIPRFLTGLFPEFDGTIAVYSATDPQQLSWTLSIGYGGVFTTELLETFSSYSGGIMLPLVTEGWLFHVEPQGYRQIVPVLGNDTRQTPQWTYECPCSPYAVTRPIRLNASYKDPQGDCGLPETDVDLVIVDWGMDRSMTLRVGEIGRLRTGIMQREGFFRVESSTAVTSDVYDATLFCDCGGAGTYSYTNSANCTTTYDVFFEKQPWPESF